MKITVQKQVEQARRDGLHPIRKDGDFILCYYGHCRRVALKEFSLPVFDDQTKAMNMYVFCSLSHQIAQAWVWDNKDKEDLISSDDGQVEI